MTHKVWYQNGGQLEVDVLAGSIPALRRAAAIITDAVGSELRFIGIEDEQGKVTLREELDDYLRGYRLRGLGGEPAVCPKYYVEVRAPKIVGLVLNQSWVRYAIESTRVRADQRAMEAEAIFGSGRVRVAGVTTAPVPV